ncbi:DUF2325 domain-containing protein [Undibacterium sp. RuTC16W]|uniref:DUF2325 domain-containing protein n=1 Tax=Undibacterium sp. RuTC16W TaxID=3413048 RepID=UPI003BF09230
MCEQTKNAALHQNGLMVLKTGMKGSRRRRLWELPYHALCPVIGVCLPIHVLRRLVDKALGGQTVADDYELHCGAIADCKFRSEMTERLQAELERRYAIALRQATRYKTTDALSSWWAQGQHSNDVAGVLWATLTHARCDSVLEERVLREIHMLQHQVGTTERVSSLRFAEMQVAYEVIGKELSALQERSNRIVSAKSAAIDQLQTDQVQLRAALIGKNTVIASLQDQIKELETGFPDLRVRQEQARHIELQMARIHDLEKQIAVMQRQHSLVQSAQHQQQLQHPQTGATTLLPTSPSGHDAASLPQHTNVLSHLQNRSVLCVGGRPHIVPMYRQMIERTGGHFLHHDGGDEDNPALLGASLAAADLVICQTGCVSHGAYWRVKDHCKRTGKPCVFVDKPSVSSMARCLKTMAQTVQSVQAVQSEAHDKLEKLDIGAAGETCK